MLNLFSSCAHIGCPLPGLFQIRNVKDGEELAAMLCLIHLIEAQQAIQAMNGLREEDSVGLLPEAEDPKG